MDYNEILVLFFIGIFSGVINTIAGGGSLLTLPILIFMGLPPNIANGTNRIQLIMQNIFAVSGFKSKGVSDFKFSSWLSLTAITGSIVGAQIAIDIPEELFKKILSIIMILVIITIIFKKNKPSELLNNYASKNKFISIILFFFVGIYGGFLHAGVGFIILTILSNINNIKLSNANSIKVFVALAFSIVSLFVFVYEGKVNWIYGINIGIGSALGGWIASRWSYNKSDRII